MITSIPDSATEHTLAGESVINNGLEKKDYVRFTLYIYTCILKCNDRLITVLNECSTYHTTLYPLRNLRSLLPFPVARVVGAVTANVLPSSGTTHVELPAARAFTVQVLPGVIVDRLTTLAKL